MRRFMVFGHEPYEAAGGLGDIKADTDDLDEAKTMARTLDASGMVGIEIVERDTWIVVWDMDSA